MSHEVGRLVSRKYILNVRVPTAMIVEDVQEDRVWLEQWERLGWRQHIEATLRSIIWNPDTATDDRLGALKILNQAIGAGLLPADPSLPDTTCRIMLWTSQLAFKPRWWKRLGLKKRQARIVEQLYAVRWILATAEGFVERARSSAVAPNRQQLAS